MINIVLVNPEIPNNTGNIVRTCAVTGALLHVIEPCGFSWEDKYLKRSGLDYWELAAVKRYNGMQEFLQLNFGSLASTDSNIPCAVKDTALSANKQFLFASKKAAHNYINIDYDKDCYVFFGRETKGLDEDLLKENYENCVRIPMREGARCLNLANSVAIITYEYLRQFNFEGLEEVGSFKCVDNDNSEIDAQ